MTNHDIAESFRHAEAGDIILKFTGHRWWERLWQRLFPPRRINVAKIRRRDMTT